MFIMDLNFDSIQKKMLNKFFICKLNCILFKYIVFGRVDCYFLLM